MRIYTSTQQSIAASDYKSIRLLFDVTLNGSASVDYRWSTYTFLYNSNSYLFKVISDSFSGITIQKDSSEIGVSPPNTCEFSIANSDGSLSSIDFTDAEFLISFLVSDGVNESILRSFLMRVKSFDPSAAYGQIDFKCEDFLQKYLEMEWPITTLISSLFPSTTDNQNLSDTAKQYSERVKDNLCAPECFGTAYPPLRPLYISGARRYILGPTGRTYNVTECHSPSDKPVSKWASPPNTFKQGTYADSSTRNWRTISPLIMDSNNDGVNDSVGVWIDGSTISDVPFKMTISGRETITSPSDIISWILQNIGVDASKIDLTGSFLVSKGVYAARGIEFNFSQFTKVKLKEVLSKLLVLCDSYIIVTDKVELHVYNPVVVGTVFNTQVISNFSSSPEEKSENDGCYFYFRQITDPETKVKKAEVPCVSSETPDNPNSEVIDGSALTNTSVLQSVLILNNFRRFKRKSTVTLNAMFKKIAHDPGDFITISDQLFGGTYNVMVESVTFNPFLESHLQINAVRFDGVAETWGSFTPAAITVSTDNSTGAWSPIISGPDSSGNDSPYGVPNIIWQRLKVLNPANINDYILIDGVDPIISLISDSDDYVNIGLLASNTIGIQIKDDEGRTVFQSDSINGAQIGGFFITDELLSSAKTGARIEINKLLSRISIFDETDEKVVMGYLDGLPKNDGAGNWGSNNYGFWARNGDQLSIDGDVQYVSGDWIVEDDASIKIYNSSAQEIIRLGTDLFEKGLWLYNPVTSNSILQLGTKSSDIGLYLYSDNSAHNLLAKYSGTGLTINDGGDIILENTDNTDPSEIIFKYGNNNKAKITTYFYNPYVDFRILPYDDYGRFYVGVSGVEWNTISLRSKNGSTFYTYYNSSYYSYISNSANDERAYSEIFATSSGGGNPKFRIEANDLLGYGYAYLNNVNHFSIQNSIRAYNFDGISIADDSGNVGIKVYDGGNVSVGNVADVCPLYVRKSLNSNYIQRIVQEHTGGHGLIIQLGEATPTSGRVYASFRDSGGGTDGSITATGSGTVAFNTSSDKRLKKDIKLLSEKESFEKIKKLKPVSFKSINNDNDGESFIAQDLFKILPLCTTSPQSKEDYWQIDKSAMVPRLVSAIQYLIKIVEDHQKIIKKLTLEEK